MGIVVVLGVVAGVYLLSRILKTQQVRTQIEATRLELANVERRFGTWADAKRDGRLIEYLEGVAAMGGLPSAQQVSGFRGSASREEAADVARESLQRGVRTRFLGPDDYIDLGAVSVPEENALIWCVNQCDSAADLRLPPECMGKPCPFCGGPTKNLHQEFWDRHEPGLIDRWERFRALYPEAAAKESKAHYTDADRAEFEEAMAEHLNPSSDDEDDEEAS